MSKKYSQNVVPNFGVAAIRGWCLAYVDDAGNAPTRRASAQNAADAEANAGRLRNDQLPNDVWVVIFFSLSGGAFKGLGHVAFAKRSANGSIEIRDSEVRAGARKPYTSIQEVLNWFANHKPAYLGWSTDCDGRKYVNIGDNDMIEDNQRHYDIIAQEFDNATGRRARTGSKLSRDEFRRSFVGRDKLEALVTIHTSPETGLWQKYANAGMKNPTVKILERVKQLALEIVKVIG